MNCLLWFGRFTKRNKKSQVLELIDSNAVRDGLISDLVLRVQSLRVRSEILKSQKITFLYFCD